MFKNQLLSQKTFEAEPGSIYALRTSHVTEVSRCLTRGSKAGARMLWSSYAHGARTLSWLGHGCCGHRMLSEHERSYGLGTDALVIVCSRSTNVIMAWAWMLWSSYALGARTLLWSGHGCSGHRMLSEHERYYGHGMVWPWTKSKYVYCLNKSTSHRTPK